MYCIIYESKINVNVIIIIIISSIKLKFRRGWYFSIRLFMSLLTTRSQSQDDPTSQKDNLKSVILIHSRRRLNEPTLTTCNNFQIISSQRKDITTSFLGFWRHKTYTSLNKPSLLKHAPWLGSVDIAIEVRQWSCWVIFTMIWSVFFSTSLLFAFAVLCWCVKKFFHCAKLQNLFWKNFVTEIQFQSLVSKSLKKNPVRQMFVVNQYFFE